MSQHDSCFILHRFRQEKGKSTSVCLITSLKKPCQKRYKLQTSTHALSRDYCWTKKLWSSHHLKHLSAPQCRDALTTRQKLISQDYRVSYSLAKACKLDLRKQRCSLDTNLPRAREARLSYLLLCLEAAVHRGESTRHFHLLRVWTYIVDSKQPIKLLLMQLWENILFVKMWKYKQKVLNFVSLQGFKYPSTISSPRAFSQWRVSRRDAGLPSNVDGGFFFESRDRSSLPDRDWGSVLRSASQRPHIALPDANRSGRPQFCHRQRLSERSKTSAGGDSLNIKCLKENVCLT